jgi:hypothetical protein
MLIPVMSVTISENQTRLGNLVGVKAEQLLNPQLRGRERGEMTPSPGGGAEHESESPTSVILQAVII